MASKKKASKTWLLKTWFWVRDAGDCWHPAFFLTPFLRSLLQLFLRTRADTNISAPYAETTHVRKNKSDISNQEARDHPSVRLAHIFIYNSPAEIGISLFLYADHCSKQTTVRLMQQPHFCVQFALFGRLRARKSGAFIYIKKKRAVASCKAHLHRLDIYSHRNPVVLYI